MARKRAGQPHNRAGKKKRSQGKKKEIDWSNWERWAQEADARNRGRIEAGETFRSGRVRERGKAPGRTDGQQYG